MSCTHCQTLPVISQSGGELIISCAVGELASKFSLYLNANNVPFTLEDPQTLWVSVDHFSLFLESLYASKYFSTLECKGITLLLLENGEKLTPSKLTSMRTLQLYKNLIGTSELSDLITKGALTTHFQPIIDLQSNTIYGYESLARGVDDEGKLIYPDTLF
jgi:hypothetical protein